MSGNHTIIYCYLEVISMRKNHIVFEDGGKTVDILFEEGLGRVYISCSFENKNCNYIMTIPTDRFWETIQTASKEKLASLCEPPAFDLKTSVECTVANARQILDVDAAEIVPQIKEIEATTEQGFRKRIAEIAMSMDVNPILICKLPCVAYSRSEHASYVAAVIEKIRDSLEETA